MRGVRVRHGDEMRFGVMESEFRVMLVDVVVFIPSRVEFNWMQSSVEGRVVWMKQCTFYWKRDLRLTMEMAKAIATGKTVINYEYLNDCLKRGQLLDDAPYRMTFPKVNVALQHSPSHAFLSFFGVRFEEGGEGGDWGEHDKYLDIRGSACCVLACWVNKFSGMNHR